MENFKYQVRRHFSRFILSMCDSARITFWKTVYNGKIPIDKYPPPIPSEHFENTMKGLESLMRVCHQLQMDYRSTACYAAFVKYFNSNLADMEESKRFDAFVESDRQLKFAYGLLLTYKDARDEKLDYLGVNRVGFILWLETPTKSSKA